MIGNCAHGDRWLTIVQVSTDRGIRRVLAGRCSACGQLFRLDRGWSREYAGAFTHAERPNRRTLERS
jgi:radical SAM superfamily enzyme with C-terminal helix-hairpin-helix motif